MKPHIPQPFPPTNVELEPHVALIGRANAALARYDGLLESLVNPAVLLSPLLMKEAELSSRIEGTIATANEVYQQQAGEEFEPEKEADISEILNYRKTLRNASDEIAERPISLHMIRQMHANLMQGVRGADKNPGKFRTTQNWIGSKGCPIEDAIYVPPPPTKLGELLDEFARYIGHSSDDLDPIVQAALLHAQFELIHPFDDGNGRIGRLLIPLFLARRGSLVGPSLYISGYLEREREAYYYALKSISEKGSWSQWVAFFTRAVIEQATANLDVVRRIKSLYEEKKHEITSIIHSDQAIHLLDILFDTPIFRATAILERLGIKRQRAARYVRELKAAAIVKEVRPAMGRRSALLYFPHIFDITG